MDKDKEEGIKRVSSGSLVVALYIMVENEKPSSDIDPIYRSDERRGLTFVLDDKAVCRQRYRETRMR